MKSNEKKLTLFLLCWIFGLLGVHRFYTAKYITGVLQFLVLGLAVALALFEFDILNPLALLTVISVLLWWIIDFMRIIMGKFTDRVGNQITEWI